MGRSENQAFEDQFEQNEYLEDENGLVYISAPINFKDPMKNKEKKKFIKIATFNSILKFLRKLVRKPFVFPTGYFDSKKNIYLIFF